MSKANTKTGGTKKGITSLFRNNKPLAAPLPKKGKTSSKGKTTDFGTVMDSLSNYRFI